MKDKLNTDKFIFNQKAIKYLSDIVNSTNLTEIEYKCADISIKISKRTETPVAAPTQFYSQQQQPALVATQTQATPAATAVVESAQSKYCTAPVVGKVYVAEKPGAPALIKVGDKIEVGQKIFIIEAMKVMNNVKATEGGIVERILIQDGQAVEYGQKLVELK